MIAQIASPARMLLERGGSQAFSNDLVTALIESDYKASSELAHLYLERELLNLDARRSFGNLRSGKGVSADQVAEWDSLISRMRKRWLQARDEAFEILQAAGIAIETIEDVSLPVMDADETPALTSPTVASLKQDPRDSKVVEIEIAQAVAERLVAWGKIFAIVVAIPLTLLALALTIVGISNWSDFTSKVNQGSAAIDKKIADAAARAGRSQSQLDGKIASAIIRAEAVEGQIGDLTSQYGEMQSKYKKDQGILGSRSAELAQKYAMFNEKYKQMSVIQGQFKELDRKVDNLEEKLGLSGSMLSDFERYVSSLGFPSKSKLEDIIKVDENIKLNIFWNGKQIVVPPEYLALGDIFYHEYTHKISGEYGRPNLESDNGELEEAIADFLSMSYLGQVDIGRTFVSESVKIQPNMAKAWPDGYIRSAKVTRRFRPVTEDRDNGNVEAWLGILWDIRTAIGCAEHQPKCPDAERLILTTYFDFTKSKSNEWRRGFAVALLERLEKTEKNAVATQARDAMKLRGMTI